MAASQNPIQGSLFGESEESSINEAQPNSISQITSENLSQQQLKEDASRRPRLKKSSTNPNKINDLEEFTKAEIEEPKWSHHNLPNIDDLTPALRHYVH